jgi:hypothetical protein
LAGPFWLSSAKEMETAPSASDRPSINTSNLLIWFLPVFAARRARSFGPLR